MQRLNKGIGLIEEGKVAFGPFAPSRSIPDGPPPANLNTVERQIDDGRQFPMASPGRDTSALRKGHRLAGR